MHNKKLNKHGDKQKNSFFCNAFSSPNASFWLLDKRGNEIYTAFIYPQGVE